jgi:hypothetical protein
MPLLWTPVASNASWTSPPGPPRVIRAAIPGQGWLVATQVSGGWSTVFVPDPGAADPPEEAASGGFQAAKIDWSHPAAKHAHPSRAHAQEHEEAPGHAHGTTKHRK